MKRASRRDFLKSSLAGAGAVSFGLLALSQAGCQRKFGEVDSPLGPLQPVADENTGLPLLWLPQGFRYRTIAWAGDPMSDGLICPNRFDGMGIVSQTDTEIRMIRNHEARGSSGAIGPPEHSYDVTGGGTVTLVFDREREIMTESWVSLSGTLNNCAGGITPGEPGSVARKQHFELIRIRHHIAHTGMLRTRASPTATYSKCLPAESLIPSL